MAKVGQRIKAAREQAGLSQQDLAYKLGLNSYQSISQYERGVRTPKYDTLLRIADALGVSVNSLDDNIGLDRSVASVFVERAGTVLSMCDPADIEAAHGTAHYFDYLFQAEYRPTANDVKEFAAETGVTEEYLLGLTDDENGRLSSSNSVDELDYGLAILHVQKFLTKDLHQYQCSLEDAEYVTKLVLEYIQAKNLVSFARMVDQVSSEIRRAAIAVLVSGLPEEKIPGSQRAQLEKCRNEADNLGLLIEIVDGKENCFNVLLRDERTIVENGKNLSIEELGLFLKLYAAQKEIKAGILQNDGNHENKKAAPGRET